MGFLDRFIGKGGSEKTEIFEVEDEDKNEPNRFMVDEVYDVGGIPVVAGRVLSGKITKDSITVIKGRTVGIGKIQAGKHTLREIGKGESCAMILTRVNKHELREKSILNFSP